MASAMPSPFAGKLARNAHAHGNAPGGVPASVIPSGTFVPGTKVQVGSHRVVIEKYLSEGGFAHVYLVRLPNPVNGDDGAVLKRVAVPDRESLASMRIEVETMKKLQGHRHIVTYIDSHASQLKGGGFEVFLLMEYCSGGGLIDFMNTRLQNRLTEPEILKIFSDVAQGVASMHYLKPPLLHRDLKVENILISTTGSVRQFKLCDFGSTAPPRPAATSAAEGRLIEDDIQKNTTLQYRSPEMIDVYRNQPIDEKSDIWALGVLLYKLCYYTTPFEEMGQMAILNASFKFPGYPSFTDRLKALIASMLREKPSQRPNIYQVLREICLMRGTDIPIRDIYSSRTASEVRRNEQLPSGKSNIVHPPTVGAYKAAPLDEKITLPDITPMRRGRPTTTNAAHPGTRPSPSPLRIVSSDPFAALDSNPGLAPASVPVDDISSRFPPLEQFSLLHESGGKFAFDQKKAPATPAQPNNIAQRVTEALADDAFALPASAKPDALPLSKSAPTNAGTSGLKSSVGTQTSLKSAQLSVDRPSMISTGTMTSPPAQGLEGAPGRSPSRQIYRFPPSDQRSSSQTRATDVRTLNPSFGKDTSAQSRPSLLDHKSKSHVAAASVSHASISSRPSLEDHQRPAAARFSTHLRSSSTNSRSQPSGNHPESAPLSIPHRSASTREPSGGGAHQGSYDSKRDGPLIDDSVDGTEPTSITSNVEFLRTMEEEDPAKKREKRSGSGSKQSNRRSMPTISLSGTKSILAGRFGDAFRRFEANTGGPRDTSPPGEKSGPSLTPIAGSEATDERSDDGQVIEEVEQTPEFRRELERRRLSVEERRVAEAAAAYKQQVAERGNDGTHTRGRELNRAAMIQNKVQALLDETNKSSPTKTAEGYGRFTNPPAAPHGGKAEPLEARSTPPISSPRFPPGGTAKPSGTVDLAINRTRQPPGSAAPTPASPIDRSFARPSAPPKPQALRTGGREPLGHVAAKPASLGNRTDQNAPPAGAGAGAVHGDDWETTFSKRYPSLSGLEMVETAIDKSGGVASTRDV